MSGRREIGVKAQPDTEVDTAIAQLRSLAYGYLANGFQTPEAESFETDSASFISGWRSVLECLRDEEQLRPILERLEECLGDHTYQSLHARYQYLFAPQGGIQVSPYETESTRETPQHAMCQAHEFADIAGFYKAFGLEVSEESPERVDHVAAELEFMHVMACKEVAALEGGEEEHVEIVRDAGNKFREEHLGRWTGTLKRRLAEADRDGFYANLGELLDKWVDLDRRL